MKRNEILEQHAAVIGAAVTAAAEANIRLSALARLGCERVWIHRIFLFQLEEGVDFGFTTEEFGSIEPFASIPVSSIRSD